MDFTQSMDNGYMIPTSVAVGSGEATDIRCVCDTVEDFKTFLDTTGMELRYEGLVTYEKVNKLLKVYKGNDTWQTVGEGGGGVDTSSFITLTQLSQQLSNYYTKAQTDNKISEEIAKIQSGAEGGVQNPISAASYKLANKKWLAIGDSITAKTFHSEKNYHDFISEKTGCVVSNYGKDGWTIVQMSTEVSKMPTDVDVITLFMGTNDWHIGKVPLGNFLDTGTSTVSGAINEMLKALMWSYGEKSILVFSPLPRYNGNQYGYNCSANDRGYTLLELVDVLKKTCEHYSIPFLDLYRQSGFHMAYTQSRETYFTDGLHPNITGHEILSNLMLSFMESNVKEYTKAVSETVPVTGISIQSAITLKVGESATLSPTLTPSNATDKRVQWNCDNDNASVSSNGVVTANKQGQSVVIATTNDGGFSSQCIVTIETGTSVTPPLDPPANNEIDGEYLTDFALAYTNIPGNSIYYSYVSNGVIKQESQDGRATTSLPILALKPNTYYRLNCSDESFYMSLSDYTEGKWKASEKGDMYFKTGVSGKCRIHFSAGVTKQYSLTLTQERWDGKTTELTD